jgi:hypothetical protein
VSDLFVKHHSIARHPALSPMIGDRVKWLNAKGQSEFLILDAGFLMPDAVPSLRSLCSLVANDFREFGVFRG